MQFITRLFIFAVGLTVAVGGYKGYQKLTHPRHEVRVVQVHERLSPPDVPSPAEAPAAPDLPVPPIVSVPRTQVLGPGDVRIATTNGAAFLALRDSHLVAGLTDSLRQLATTEMRREMGKDSSSQVGRIIESAVRSSVEKLLAKEIAVPLADIRSIDYTGKRIVIVYKRGEPSGLINFETVKGDGNRTLLEQFSEADARRFVEVVRARIR